MLAFQDGAGIGLRLQGAGDSVRVVGASNSSGSLASGTAAPSTSMSHLSFTSPFGLTVNG